MTKEHFMFLIASKKEIEFEFKGKTYIINYGKDNKGKDNIIFGQLYEGKPFEDVGDLLNNAKIENYFFKEIIEDL